MMDEDSIKWLVDLCLENDLDTLKQQRRVCQKLEHPSGKKCVKVLDIAMAIKRLSNE